MLNAVPGIYLAGDLIGTVFDVFHNELACFRREQRLGRASAQGLHGPPAACMEVTTCPETGGIRSNLS